MIYWQASKQRFIINDHISRLMTIKCDIINGPLNYLMIFFFLGGGGGGKFDNGRFLSFELMGQNYWPLRKLMPINGNIFQGH